MECYCQQCEPASISPLHNSAQNAIANNVSLLAHVSFRFFVSKNFYYCCCCFHISCITHCGPSLPAVGACDRKSFLFCLLPNPQPVTCACQPMAYRAVQPSKGPAKKCPAMCCLPSSPGCPDLLCIALTGASALIPSPHTAALASSRQPVQAIHLVLKHVRICRCYNSA